MAWGSTPQKVREQHNRAGDSTREFSDRDKQQFRIGNQCGFGIRRQCSGVPGLCYLCYSSLTELTPFLQPDGYSGLRKLIGISTWNAILQSSVILNTVGTCPARTR